MVISDVRSHLLAGQAIPALPLALDEARKWSVRHQRGLVRYYFDAGAGGLAVAVHSTQFEIRQPQHALLRPVLQLAAEEASHLKQNADRPFLLIAGVCGKTPQALAEAELAQTSPVVTVMSTSTMWMAQRSNFHALRDLSESWRNGSPAVSARPPQPQTHEQ